VELHGAKSALLLLVERVLLMRLFNDEVCRQSSFDRGKARPPRAIGHVLPNMSEFLQCCQKTTTSSGA
jgi:hypothetical protein